MNDNAMAQAFTEYAARKLNDHYTQIKRCAALLSSEQVWYRPNESSNAVGNLLLHLRGNIRQWILSGIAARPGDRDRQAEFDQREPLPVKTLVDNLGQTIDEAVTVIEEMPSESLVTEYAIQGYTVSGVAAVTHVVEHLAFHTGQIVTTTKWLLDVDLSLYDERGHRKNGRDAGVP